jgi:hypothetical protein
MPCSATEDQYLSFDKLAMNGFITTQRWRQDLICLANLNSSQGTGNGSQRLNALVRVAGQLPCIVLKTEGTDGWFEEYDLPTTWHIGAQTMDHG